MNGVYLYNYRYNLLSRTNTYLPDTWGVRNASVDYFKNILGDYKSYDSTNQLRLYKLSEALTAINYKIKSGNPSNLIKKYQTIKRICNEVDGSHAFSRVNYSKLDIRRKL